MLKTVLLFIAGLVCLIKGGDDFVDGATGIARHFHLPEILIGATIVSIGTTLPEVMVSTTSAAGGHSQIAYGNAIGSIICNTALIAAIPILVRPGKVDRKALATPVAFFFVSAAAFAVMAYGPHYFPAAFGAGYLVVFVIYMTVTVLQAKNSSGTAEADGGEEQKERKPAFDLVFLVFGAVLIAIGADLLVDNGTKIAEGLGVPESVIALTFVALGTSLPELITAITSLVKGHSALSLGNIIGANLFDLILVCGASITLKPFPVPSEAVIFGHNASLVLEIPLMFTVMLILTVPALAKGELKRWQGGLMLALYAAFCCIQFNLG